MSAQHTQGPIRYDYAPGYCGELIASDGHSVATFDDEPSPEDASRLVACWNACEGLKTDLLENIATIGDTLASRFKLRDQTERKLTATHEELLKAIRSIAAITTRADQGPEAMCAEIQGICRVALAKVTGGAA